MEKINPVKLSKSKTVFKIIGLVFLFLFIFAFLFVAFAAVFRRSNWSNLSLFELITQLKSLSGTSFESIRNFLLAVVVPSASITLFLFLAYVLLRFFFRKHSKRKWILFSFLSLSLVSPLCFFIPETVLAYNYLDVGGYIQNANKQSEFIDNFYVDPNGVTRTFPEKKRNLILLYRESRERTYSDTDNGGFFDDNYIPELTKLALENESFSDGKVLNGSVSLEYTNWTRAGLFSTSAGLPFKTSLGQNNRDTQESFFPNVRALGDILNSQGYDQTFLCGSDSAFAGRRLYFQGHGNFAIHDFYTYNSKYNVHVENQWGFRDYHLFDYAKEDIRDKASAYDTEEVPFNYERLTVDTHFHIGANDGNQDGFLCQNCPDTYGDDQYANVIACSSKQASSFVSWFYGKDGNNEISDNVRKNTTIVIRGDHPTRSTYFCKAAEKAGFERRTYVCFVNSAKTRTEKKRRRYCHFDLFPTILSSIGADISGNRLGLGVDLYSGEKTYRETFSKDYINRQLQGKSTVIDSLLKVNPYEYNYLKRMGRLPTGKGSLEEEENQYVFTLTDINRHGLDEKLADPVLILTKKDGSEFSFSREKMNSSYELKLDKNEFDLDEFESCRFTVLGETSQNSYTLDTIRDLDSLLSEKYNQKQRFSCL